MFPNKLRNTTQSGDYSYQTCPKDMHFDDSDTVCTCLPDSGAVTPCKNNMLLHFPYDTHLNDVTCHKAKSSLVRLRITTSI